MFGISNRARRETYIVVVTLVQVSLSLPTCIRLDIRLSTSTSLSLSMTHLLLDVEHVDTWWDLEIARGDHLEQRRLALTVGAHEPVALPHTQHSTATQAKRASEHRPQQNPPLDPRRDHFTT